MPTHIRLKATAIALTVAAATAAQAQPLPQTQAYPMLDPIANNVIQKYQTTSCQQLAADKMKPPTDMQKRAIQMMRQDPQLRAAFLDRVAAPIAGKLFECGFIP
ncbi:MAG: hypothetical protein ACREUW_10795 [Burkholderiales bacterium]